MKKKHLASICLVPLLLAACSSGKLVMDYTDEVAKSGHEIIKATKEYNENLITLHDEWVAALLDFDPNCRLTSDWNITVRTYENLNSDTVLCPTKREQKKVETFVMNVRPLDRKIFTENEQILSAFSDYLTALTAYASNDVSYPVSKLIDKALDNASAINKKANLNDNQKKSISGLTSFLQRLATEEQNKGDISSVIKEMGPEQSKNLDALLLDVKDKKQTYFNTMSNDILNITLSSFNNRANLPPQKAVSADKMVKLKKTTENYIKEPTATEKAIRQYQDYNNALLSIINDTITDDKIKEQKIAIQKANLKEGLGYIKDFIKELGPVILAAM